MNITKTRAVILPQYNDNLIRALLGLKIEEIDIPELRSDDVLIRLEAAPCNPSDIAFLRGGYNIVKPLPAVPGFEGTGEVVDTGENARNLLGKKVSCFSQDDADGTWAEYFRVKASDCIVLKKGMEMEQAACLSINPLTAIGLFAMVEQAGNPSFIVNAAGGQVPDFMRMMAAEKGIEVINIVRRPEQVAHLKSEGQQWVLNNTDDYFTEQFKEACNNLKPAFAFDAVAGDMAGRMLNCMPGGATLVVYGGLSGQAVSGLDPMGLIFRHKKVMGFNLNDWIAGMDRETFQQYTDFVQEQFIRGKFKTTIQGHYKLEEVVTGIRTYIKSMSSGKILLIRSE